MAEVAQGIDPGGGDQISSKDVQKKLEELTLLAQKMTPNEMQILSELKKADTGLNQQKPKNQKMMRGGNRIHPYNNWNSNRPPRRGPRWGQINNCRPVANEGFGPMRDNRYRGPIWHNQPQLWGPGLPAIEQNQLEHWSFNQQMPCRPRMESRQWGPGSGPNQWNEWGPGFEPNRQRDPAWQMDLDPIPTFPVELPSPWPQQPPPPEVGKRLNSLLDSGFINPKTRLQQQQTSSFADDTDNCGLVFGPLRRQNSQETIRPRTSQDMPRPSSRMGQPCLQPLMPNFNDTSNFQFKTFDELQRAQQQQQQLAQQQIKKLCPPGWSRGNHF